MSLPARVRAHLQQLARSRSTITYQELAAAMQLEPPNTIHQLTNALEALMREDAAASQPLLAALVLSRRPPHLPQTGFFELAQELRRFDGDPEKRAVFHANQIEQVYEASDHGTAPNG